MGLLDDAIREHLELKRSRGADPEELARAEHEALEPVGPEAPADPRLDPPAPVEEDATALEMPVAAEPAGEEDAAEEPAEEAPSAGEIPAQAGPEPFSSVGQETAEIDMSTVLAEDRELAEHAAGEPQDAGDGAPGVQEIPGQERLSFE